ncbi:MAG TPA: ABC transporter C-terminal domain-containing protein [Candidatus Baltobacteraceae bacterium]|jgi:hypothetical protein
MSSGSFIEAVAERSGQGADAVDEILERNRIVSDAVPSVARRLKVTRIAFRGTKTLHDEKIPFDFERSDLDDGLWLIASEDNLVGKSSILQIMLWAIRGEPKSLATDVRAWLDHVEVDLVADTRSIAVKFDIANGTPAGSVTIEGEPTPLEFGNSPSFKRIMQDVMLKTLGFDPIPATMKINPEGDIKLYQDGWTSYTGAFLSDPKSNSIIGEDVPETNLTQRLLQVFLGIPWATTHFQARAAKRILENEAAQQKRRLASVGGRTVASLESEIAMIDAQISDEGARQATVAELTAKQRQLDSILEQLTMTRMDLAEREALVADREDSVVRKERLLLDAKEESTSSAFFKQLNPVVCPRCSTKITEERRKREAAEHHCSVCTTMVLESGEDVSAAEIAEAEDALATAKRDLESARKASSDKRAIIINLTSEREEIARDVARLGRLGTSADVQILEKQKERQLGMLEIVTSVLGEQNQNDQELAVVSAAEAEAEARTKQAADTVLEVASQEITRIVQALGAKAFDSVHLDRAAHCKVSKGGETSHFSKLTDGEQLRLRIATILSLMHTTGKNKTGRHPGFLLIDSPGAADLKAENVAEAIREIAAVVEDLMNIQVFVAMRGVELAKSVAPRPERVIAAAEGKYIW